MSLPLRVILHQTDDDLPRVFEVRIRSTRDGHEVLMIVDRKRIYDSKGEIAEETRAYHQLMATAFDLKNAFDLDSVVVEVRHDTVVVPDTPPRRRK